MNILQFSTASLGLIALVAVWSPSVRQIRLAAALLVASVLVSALAGVLGLDYWVGRVRGLTYHPNQLGALSAIAAGPAIGTADEGFDNYGYRPLADEFDVAWLDLNQDDTVTVPAFDDDLNAQYLNMSRTMADSYVVSVTRTKTHNDVVVTLGLKNILVGTLAGRAEKQKIHQGSRAINLTLAKMAQHVAPDLTVLDGTEGMQGNGPVSGDPIDSRITLASAHSIAADVVGLQAMGYRLDQVGYLRYAMELRGLTLDDIEVVGERIEDVRIDFRPHDNIAGQLTWPVDGDWRPVFDAVG